LKKPGGEGTIVAEFMRRRHMIFAAAFVGMIAIAFGITMLPGGSPPVPHAQSAPATPDSGATAPK
jgi:hypothetical protein